MGVERDESAVDVINELVGARTMPLLVGVMISCDTKTTEVMRTVLASPVDVVGAAGFGTNRVAASKGLEEVKDELVGPGPAKTGLMEEAARV